MQNGLLAGRSKSL